MYRAPLVGNRLVFRRLQQQKQERHRQKLRTIRAVTDTAAPGVLDMVHLKNNLKKEQLLEGTAASPLPC
jgi:hypothetical protein